MNISLTRVTTLAFGAALAGTLLAGTAASAADQNRWPGTKAGAPTPKVKGVPPELAKNLANFDDLDFRVYTNQQWQDLHKSHTKDVVVHWPDGLLADGKIIQPTGKAYRIPMATIGHWNKQGIMFEEFLFWDNGEFMKQIGLAQ